MKIPKQSRVEFAPDGIHWQLLKSGKIEKMYDYFTQNPDIRIQLSLNPQAKFRLWGEKGNKVIGILPKPINPKQSSLVLKGKKQYVQRMYKHLRKEHPSTKRKMSCLECGKLSKKRVR